MNEEDKELIFERKRMNIELLAKETIDGRRSYSKFVQDTLLDARKQHPPMRSILEGFAIIYEEFKEFEEEALKKKIDKTALLLELASVAAMCQRLAEDILRVGEVPT